MRTAYGVLACLVAAGVAFQASAIALGFFEIVSEVEDGAAITTDHEHESNLGLVLHSIGGTVVIPALALVLLVVSFFTRFPDATAWAAGVFGLVILQVMLAYVAFGAFPVGALHGLNALVLFLAAGWAGWRVTRAAKDEKTLDTAAI